MIPRIGYVSSNDAVADTRGASRSPGDPPSIDTSALTVQATSLNLLAVVVTTGTQGSYLNPATASEQVAVLGAAAAQRMGNDQVYRGERIWLGGQWFYVAAAWRTS